MAEWEAPERVWVYKPDPDYMAHQWTIVLEEEDEKPWRKLYVPAAARDQAIAERDEALEALRAINDDALCSEPIENIGSPTIECLIRRSAFKRARAILAKHPESASKEMVEDDYGARDMLAHSRGEFERHAPDQPRDGGE